MHHFFEENTIHQELKVDIWALNQVIPKNLERHNIIVSMFASVPDTANDKKLVGTLARFITVELP